MRDYLLEIYDRAVDNIKKGNINEKTSKMDGFNIFFDITKEVFIHKIDGYEAKEFSKNEFLSYIKQNSAPSYYDSFCDCLSRVTSEKDDAASCFLYVKTFDEIYRLYRLSFTMLDNICIISFFNMSDKFKQTTVETNVKDLDELTKLYRYTPFCHELNRNAYRSGSIVYFDVLQYKAIRNIYSPLESNKVLIYISKRLVELVGDSGVCSRVHSDYFVFYTSLVGQDVIDIIEELSADLSKYNKEYEIGCNYGIYEINEELQAEELIDRAMMAHDKIKGNYTIRYNYFTKEMQEKVLIEQQLAGMMGQALKDKEFKVYYQPQYNHSTGMLIGAEALIRWIHPTMGIISPGVFIPLFEKNGFVTNIDLYVFEETCRFLRRCLDDQKVIVPISFNVSRNDMFHDSFIHKMEKIRRKYKIPVDYVRVEITESSIAGNVKFINEFVGKLHDYGYIVEMDDFGSGYSSLNVLKDIDLDIIKLDMKFLYEESDLNRGGTIISSVVRMAKWLKLPVIAEGVEQIEQADFLKSIGCDYIQGYLYSKPIPEDDFYELLCKSVTEITKPAMVIADTLNANEFWSPFSQETLIFSNYVGAAAIIDYHDDKIEMLRVNEKYVQEIGMGLNEKQTVEIDPYNELDKDNQYIYKQMLEKAIASGVEEECETWRHVKSESCGDDTICIKSNVRLIGKSSDAYLFYVMIKNITSERTHSIEYTSTHNMTTSCIPTTTYYWTIDLMNRDMVPCYKCRRDLGLPEIVKNYPEPAIAMGIIPTDYAEKYRAWINQMIDGDIKEVEDVVPLTSARINHLVRCVVEFDKVGKAKRAICSAVPIAPKKGVNYYKLVRN